MSLITMLPFLSFYVVDKTSFLSLTILYIYYQNDVFISDNDIYYDYNDFLASILPSILLKNTCFIKIQVLFNNYIYLKSILSSE